MVRIREHDRTAAPPSRQDCKSVRGMRRTLLQILHLVANDLAERLEETTSVPALQSGDESDGQKSAEAREGRTSRDDQRHA